MKEKLKLRKKKLGNVIEGNNIWNKDIWIAGGKKGVHKHRGMFEVNNGQTINTETLKKVLKVDNKINFYKDLKLLG